MQTHDAAPTALPADAGAVPRTPGTADPWQLVRHGTDRAGFAQDESLFALANGSLGVRGGFEEDDSPSQGCFLAGVWERSPITYHERFTGFARHTDTRVPVADASRIRLRLGETPVRLDEGEWLSLERRLDLRQGCYRRTLRWRAPSGGTLEIVAERLVALDRPDLLAIRYRVRSIDYRGPITLESAIDTVRAAIGQGDDPRIGAHLHGGLQLRDTHADAGIAWVAQHTTRSDIRLVCAQTHRCADSALTFQNAACTPDGVIQTYAGQLVPGGEVTLDKFAAWSWSQPGATDPTDPALLSGAEAALAAAGQAGFPSLLAGQAALLATLWQTADLAIDGAPDVEQALRFNLFQLFQSGSRDDHGSVAAKGLTGEGYEGHCFWDAEAFMLPVLVTAAPELARHMLAWRHATLDRARAHARELNHARGALYPWRTISGDECSAYFPGGSAQYHINAAVAWAIRLYVDATGDETFLRDMGAEMLCETARIWLQIGHYNPRRDGAFCIHEVTGPDEYSALADNNHYTNRMAQRHLRDAAATLEWLAATHPAAHVALVRHLDLGADEASAWRRAADAMYLVEDPRLGIFPQDDGFLDKPRLTPEQMHDPALRPLLLHWHPLTIYRHQVCKQADTLLALMLAGEDVDVAAKRRNFDYYEGVTVHDSTLSASTFAVLAAETGREAQAYRYFLDTLRVDLDDLHGNAAHGLHTAAMAGSWLALSWGFGGLRVHGGQPALAPQLPGGWRSYRFGLRWRGTQLRVEVDAAGVRYALLEGDALDFLHRGQPQHLRKGEVLQFRHTPAASHELKAVIFDLDGVLADTAVLHREAWQQLAAEIDAPFDEAIAERMKGVDRMGSLEILLERAPRHYGDAEKAELAARKNARYVELIERLDPRHLLPGARAAVESVRRAGLKTALASASRNAPQLLARLGIAGLFDYVVDAGRIARSKPDPEIFLAAAAGLDLAPADCLGVEDAAAGIASIHAAGMAAIGIGRADALADADVLLPNIAAFDIRRIRTTSGPSARPSAVATSPRNQN
ncbi:beta-phosphoglucomutase [Rhodanobacter sp. DHG33]|uniref:beta-phosphoglucomutase n=1 Tax=Rhodanobacter sp. DHG33 TaxID=2775921 RepID=UPI0031BAC855